VLNTYLFVAFSALWVLFFVYAWSLSRRQARLQKELEELKSKQGVRSQESGVGNQE
jgi:CcmD family protein